MVESPEVQAIKREREGLEIQKANKARLPSMKTNRTGAYMMLKEAVGGEGYARKMQKTDTTEGPGVPAI